MTMSLNDFFNRNSPYIGVAAYKTQMFWHVIEDYLQCQEELDRQYGHGKLQELVDDDMAKRFHIALGKFKYCIQTSGEDKESIEMLQKRSEICKRGLNAMAEYVKTNDLVPKPDIWIVDGKLPPTRYGIVKDCKELDNAKRIYKNLTAVYCLPEIAVILEDYEKVKVEVEKKFNNTPKIIEVNQPENEGEKFYDDDVPF